MLRVVSWNINGIRSPLQGLACQEPSSCPTALRRVLDELDADIVCLQETKVTRDVLTEPLAIVEGYNSYFSFSRSRSGYSGVATFCKDSATPVAAEEGLSGVFATLNGDIGCYGNMDEFTQEELRVLDSEGRALLTQHKIRTLEGKEKTLTLINVYCPHADPGKPERLTFKMRFYRLLQMRAEALLAAGSHVIILGDLNTAHRPIDHCDASSLMSVLPACMYRWVPCGYLLLAMVGRRCQILLELESYNPLRVNMWVLGVKPRSSLRATGY